MGLFMVILKDPEAARALGLLGAKAQLTAGTADWPTYWSLLGQAVTVGGSDPVRVPDRVGLWSRVRRPDRPRAARVRDAAAHDRHRQGPGHRRAGASRSPAWVLLLSLAIGWLIGLPGWSDSAAIQALATIAFAALLTIALQGMTAFFAGVGHGYIAPLAWAVATVAASQVLAVLGWGAWFPWAVPAILAGREAQRSSPSVRAASRWSFSLPSLASSRRSLGGSAPTKPAEADPAGYLATSLAEKPDRTELPWAPSNGLAGV